MHVWQVFGEMCASVCGEELFSVLVHANGKWSSWLTKYYLFSSSVIHGPVECEWFLGVGQITVFSEKNVPGRNSDGQEVSGSWQMSLHSRPSSTIAGGASQSGKKLGWRSGLIRKATECSVHLVKGRLCLWMRFPSWGLWCSVSNPHPTFPIKIWFTDCDI